MGCATCAKKAKAARLKQQIEQNKLANKKKQNAGAYINELKKNGFK